MTKEKIIILATVAIDVIGMGVIIPILPFYVKQFDASPTLVMALFAVFSVFAFFSAPILGAFSDRFGRRPSLIISIASSAVGWLVFASAKSIPFLFVGRIIDGSAAGNFSTAQSYLQDIAKDDKERTANMGLIGAVFGIAFIIGPILGAALGKFSHVLPFWFVGGLATINALMAFFFLPETNHNRNRDRISINPFRPIITAINDRVLRSRYASWFMFGLATATMQTIFALYVGEVFGFNATYVSLMFTGMGIIMALNQGLLLSRFWLKKFSQAFLESWLLLFFALAFVFMGVKSLPVFIAGLIINAFTQTVIRAVASAKVANLAGETRRGEAMGIMTSVLSLSMIIGPIVGGFLYNLDFSYPYFFGAFCLTVAFIIMRYFTVHGLAPEKVLSSEQGDLIEVLE
ncbi:MAG: MFS transporter [bacterium]